MRAIAAGGARFAKTGRPEIDERLARLDQSLAWPRAAPDRRAIGVSRESLRTSELGLDQFFLHPRDPSESIERWIRLALAPRPEDASQGPTIRITLEAKRFRSDFGGEAAVESAREEFSTTALSCAPRMIEWSISTLADSGLADRVLASKISGSGDGLSARSAGRVVSAEFVRNARLADLLSRDPGRIQGPLRFFAFVDVEAPDALMEIDPIARPTIAFDPFAGRTAPMKRFRVATRFGGRAAFEGTLLWSQSTGFASLLSDGLELRAASPQTWAEAGLDRSEARAQVTAEGDFAALAAGASVVELRINKDLDFANVAQYWFVEKPTAGDASYRLRPRTAEGIERAAKAMPVPESDRWGRRELRATRLVQSESPRIQQAARAAVEQARASGAFSRASVALAALAETHRLLEGFDARMAEEDAIVPLRTEEILARGRGVCQHYANVFAAIARATGIPTRIVTGARLKRARAELHAWVEIEADEGGPWIPVEPQGRALSFPVGGYLPLALSASLDDPSDEAAVAAEIAAFFGLRASARAIVAESDANGAARARRLQAKGAIE